MVEHGNLPRFSPIIPLLMKFGMFGVNSLVLRGSIE